MANPTEVYSVKFDVQGALEALGKLETKLSSADKRARDLLQGRGGSSEIDDALKRTSDRALKLRQQFERSQNAIAAVTSKAAKETRKQTADTRKLTDAGKSLDAMMRKFSRNASTGQRAVTRAIEGTSRAVKKTDDNLRKVDGSSRRAARGMRRFGSSSAIATQSLTGLILKTSAFIGAVRGIRDVVSEYGEFDKAATAAAAKFSRIDPTLKPGTEAFARFKKELREAAEETEHSAAGVAKAADFWAKAGRSAEETKAVMKATLDFASANQDAAGEMLDVARAGDILSDALGQFRMPAANANELMESTARVASVMSAAANRANMSAEELFEAFKGAGPTLKLVGSDIEETSSLLAAMANAGIKGAAAGTQLKMSIANLSAMTGPQEAVMKKLGVSVKDADGNFRGLTTIIRDLNDATKEMGTADRAQVFAKAVGRRALPSFINLLAEGKTNLDATTQALREANGEHERLAETMRMSASAQLEMFRNKLRDVGFEIIENTGVIGELTSAVKNIDWKNVYRVISEDVVPALKTTGRIITETLIPAFQRAYRLVSAIFNPAIELAGALFGKAGKSGQFLERVLGYLITAWVTYRAILVATKAVGILQWLATFIVRLNGATAAQSAMNTQAMVTNKTLGNQVGAFGKIQGAMAVLGAFAAGWTIGTVIHEELVDPIMKARHELKELTAEFEANKKQQDAPRKKTYGAALDDLKTAKKMQQHWATELKKSKDFGYLGRGWVRHETKKLEEATAEVERLEKLVASERQKSNIRRFGEVGAEQWEPQSFADNYVSYGGRIVEQDENWGNPFGMTQMPLAPMYSQESEDTQFQRVDPLMDYVDMTPAILEQTELAKQKAIADAEYQKKSLEAMTRNETRNVTTNIEIGPTSVKIDAKGMDPAEVGRVVEKTLNKKAREDRAAIVAGTRTIAPAEL